MSWDVLVYACDSPPESMGDLPDDWQPPHLGSVDEVRGRIADSLPDVDWSSPDWGTLKGDGFSFEFSLASKASLLDCFMVHVRGGGDAVRCLSKLAADNNWFLFDLSEGEWIHLMEDPNAGWDAWQSYRDRVLNTSDSAGKAL